MIPRRIVEMISVIGAPSGSLVESLEDSKAVLSTLLPNDTVALWD
jgi:hypothetical protein